MEKEILQGNMEYTKEQLKQADDSGSHYIAVYPNLITLRKIYSDYVKTRIEEGNEVVAVLPYYETTDSVRRILSEQQQQENNNKTGFDVRKHEQSNSLVIIDSLKAHFDSSSSTSTNIQSFVESIVDTAKQQGGKNGISIFADMGSFYHYSKINELIEHEASTIQPSRYNDIHIRRFCFYHEKDFGKLRQEHKQSLLKNHNKALMITDDMEPL